MEKRNNTICDTKNSLCQETEIRAKDIGELEEKARQAGSLVRAGKMACVGSPDGINCGAYFVMPEISNPDIAERAENVRVYGTETVPDIT